MRLKYKQFFKIIVLILISFMMIASSKLQVDEIGDLEMGAQLYDSWDWILNYKEGIGNHPLWVNNKLSGIETWRCSSCHGWDYSGKGELGYPGVLSAINMSDDEILEWLDGTKNSKHDYSEFFTVAALRDITTFLHLGIMDLSEISYDNESETFKIDRTAGEELYKQECSSCHEIDGSKINFGSAENPIFMGDIGHNNPEKILHLIRFGHLEINTNTSKSLGWSLNDSVSLAAYTKFLPQGKKEGAKFLDNIDYSTQGETTEMVYFSISLVILVLLSVVFIRRKERKNSQ